MSTAEWVVVLGGLGLGYLVVSSLVGGKRVPPPPTPPAAAPAPLVWHEVLAIAADASPDEIRAAYRSLMSQYHPDKVASLGPELRELAERKSKDIAEAYRQALAARGQEP